MLSGMSKAKIITHASPSKLPATPTGRAVTGAMSFEAAKRNLSDKPLRRPNRTRQIER